MSLFNFKPVCLQDGYEEILSDEEVCILYSLFNASRTLLTEQLAAVSGNMLLKLKIDLTEWGYCTNNSMIVCEWGLKLISNSAELENF